MAKDNKYRLIPTHILLLLLPMVMHHYAEDVSRLPLTLKHLKLWDPKERPPPPKHSTTLTILEPDADFLAWEAASRLFDGID